MKHIEAFLMKFAMTFAVLFLVLGIAYGVVVFEIFLISLVITVVGFAGDLLLYPRTSNRVATGGDFVLSFVLVWLLGLLWISDLDYSLVLPALYSAALLAIGEWFFHIYLTKRLWGKKETSHTTVNDEPRQS